MWCSRASRTKWSQRPTLFCRTFASWPSIRSRTSAEKPSVAKAVTLEVEVTAAQKLALAATVGTLSLALRKAGEAAALNTRRITLSDLPKTSTTDGRYSTIAVVRGAQRSEYSVPNEGDNGRGLASVGAR